MGAAVLVALTLLGGYLLLLRVREYSRERPDPKLTYTTLTEHEKFRHWVQESLRELREMLEQCRLECKGDLQEAKRTHSFGQETLRQDLNRDSQQIAQLQGQLPLVQQRLSELTLKLDKYLSK
ncbi:MAG: hypothetical protein B7X06_00075 [Verrucomicrobia bacterium 21-51-4]|nr:MAG: hypothetical protein B7X06_00075 [Verrucomicrobia bacterium 21-51-4]